MRPLNRDEGIGRLRNELRRLGIIQTPGLLWAAFGFCGLILGADQPFGSFLDYPRVTTGMLVAGGIILA
jgi:hypothetical protein